MPQDEIDAAIAQRAATLPKTTHSTELHLRRIAHEALRLQREGWRPEPKPTPEMEKASLGAKNALTAYHSTARLGGASGHQAATKVIAAAIAQAVADARVKVPEDAVAWARQIHAATQMMRPPTFDNGVLAAADYIISHAETTYDT